MPIPIVRKLFACLLAMRDPVLLLASVASHGEAVASSRGPITGGWKLSLWEDSVAINSFISKAALWLEIIHDSDGYDAS